MKKEELKPILKDFLTDMINDWFSDKPIWKTLGNSLITANINKYDNVIDMFSDENGDIDIEEILNNITETMEESYMIDLQKYGSFLPSRILLISKEDIKKLISIVGTK